MLSRSGPPVLSMSGGNDWQCIRTIKSVYSGFSPFLRCLVCFRCVIVGGWDCLSVFVEARCDKMSLLTESDGHVMVPQSHTVYRLVRDVPADGGENSIEYAYLHQHSAYQGFQQGVISLQKIVILFKHDKKSPRPGVAGG